MTREQLAQKVDDFMSKYQGQTKGYPNDASYGGECLSIVKLYIREVFGIDAPPSGSNSAYGYWSNFPNPLSTIFEKVQNTPTGVPEKGDIPIWNTSTGGGYGHIDIFITGDVNAFTGFDQNWGGRQAHLQPHDYSNVVGWLRPRVAVPVPEPPTPPPAPPTEPPPPVVVTDPCKPYIDALRAAKTILYSPNFFWVKLRKLRELLPQ